MKLRAVASSVLALSVAWSAAGCGDKGRKESIEASNAGMKAKSDDEKISKLERATELWRGNNVAWYNLGLAHKAREDWAQAAEAFAKAAQLVPKDAMYQMWLGIAHLWSAVRKAASVEAKKLDKKIEQIKVDWSTLNLETAKQHLEQAVKLNGNLWRAHYNLGKIYDADDRPREAADAFTKSIRANPREDVAYLALIDLYRRWDLQDLAIAVATAGVGFITEKSQRSEFYFALGQAQLEKVGTTMSQADRTAAKEAVEAFGKAIEDNKTNHKAWFFRGYMQFRLGEYKKAKEDLTEYQTSKANVDEGMASSLLNEIMLKGG